MGGNITNFNIKIEFQMRGLPHAHMLLWVQPQMKLCAVNIPEFVQYLDNINAANIPGKAETSEFEKYQSWKFIFPRFSSERTIISSPRADTTPDEERKNSWKKKQNFVTSDESCCPSWWRSNSTTEHQWCFETSFRCNRIILGYQCIRGCFLSSASERNCWFYSQTISRKFC